MNDLKMKPRLMASATSNQRLQRVRNGKYNQYFICAKNELQANRIVNLYRNKQYEPQFIKKQLIKGNMQSQSVQQIWAHTLNANPVLDSLTIDDSQKWNARECYAFLRKLQSTSLKSLTICLANNKYAANELHYLEKLNNLLASHFPKLSQLQLNVNSYYFKQLFLREQTNSRIWENLQALTIKIISSDDTQIDKEQLGVGEWGITVAKFPRLQSFSIIGDDADTLMLIKQLLKSEILPRFKSLKMQRCGFDQEVIDLLMVARLPNLLSLNLAITGINECDFEQFIMSANLAKLKCLDLSGNFLKGDSILKVVNHKFLPQLQFLYLADNAFNLNYLQDLLVGLPSLIELDLSNQTVLISNFKSQDTIKDQSNKLESHNIVSLNLSKNDLSYQLRDFLTATSFSQLTTLKFAVKLELTSFIDPLVNASWFSQLKHLELNLNASFVSADATDRFVAVLARSKFPLNLETLRIINCNLSIAAVKMLLKLASLAKIKSLDLRNNQISVGELLKAIALAPLKQLHQLYISLSRDNKIIFKKELEYCKVVKPGLDIKISEKYVMRRPLRVYENLL